AKGLINRRAETAESLDRAIVYFQRAIESDPSYARAHLQLGVAMDVKAAYLTMPDLHERAIASLRRAIALRPDFAEAWRELGAPLISVGREDEAPAAVHLAALQGRHAFAKEQFEKELDFLNRVDHALKARTTIELQMRLGAALLNMGDPAAGRAALETATAAFERRLRMGTDDAFTRYYA